MKRRVFVWILSGLTLAARPGVGEDWPSWRGADGTGISRAAELPTHWSPTSNIAWKTPIPGKGHSSPIVVGEAIFVTTALAETEERVLLRIDRETGKVEWQQTVLTTPFEKLHKLNSHASSTPASDGKNVFVSFLDQDQMYIACYTLAGAKKWEVRPGPFYSPHGYCSTPLLYKDLVIVNGDHDGDGFIVALSQADGKTVWMTPRQANRNAEVNISKNAYSERRSIRSYCPPIIVPVNGSDQLMLSGTICTAGYDPQTGKLLWVCDGPSEQMVATLVHGPDLVFSLGGFPEKHLLAIKKGGAGDISKTHVQWRTSRSMPYVPSPLLYEQLLHVISDDGIYTSFDPTTGKVHHTQRLCKHTSGSMFGGAGRVYITDDTGVTVVLKNEPTFTEVARNEIDEEVYSSPAVAHDRIYLRGAEHLFAIGSN